MTEQNDELLEENLASKDADLSNDFVKNKKHIEQHKGRKKSDKKEKSQTQIVLSNEKQQQKLDEMEQAVSGRHSGRKKKVWNILFFIVNILVVAGILAYQLTREPFVPLDGLKIDFVALLCLVLVYACIVLINTFIVSYLLKRGTKKWRPALSYKVNVLGQYYDDITPLAAGGQPFQVTYLKGHDVPLSTALSVPLAKMIFSQMCWSILSLICLIVSFVSAEFNSLFSIASVIGFLLGSLVFSVTLFLSVSKKTGKKLVVGTLKLLQKMKILKNYEKYYDKLTKNIEDFQTVMNQYCKSFKDILVLFTCSMISQILYASMPFFVICAFNNGFTGVDYLTVFIMSELINMASGICPLPGGTGMSELTFSAMLGSYFTGGTLFWALITWRFFSFYIMLLHGVIVMTYDTFIGNRKYKWTVTKNRYVEESKAFKSMQIEKYKLEQARRRKRSQMREKSASR